jgi:hypothetical protein
MILRRAVQIGLAMAAAMLAATPATSGAAGTAGGGQSACVGHHPAYVEDVFEVHYASACSGHDEPELDPLSNQAGSGENVTWTLQLPRNGSFGVDSVGFGFWTGGPVTDPDSLFGQAFQELQFYPNTVVSKCNPNGGFNFKQVEGSWTVCSPV